MQRLSALMTGTLPAFVEAGRNFASESVYDDSIISQLKTHGKRIYFTGDDTWVGLFPGLMDVVHPYPSFNVHDLDSVDQAVEADIIDDLGSDKWDVRAYIRLE